MFPLIVISTVAYIAAFILAPPVDIDGYIMRTHINSQYFIS